MQPDHQAFGPRYYKGNVKIKPDYSQFFSCVVLGFAGKSDWRRHFSGVVVGGAIVASAR
jgi:hypothetical protein